MKVKGLILVLALVMAMAGFEIKAGESDCQALIDQSEKFWMEENFDKSDQLLNQAKQLCPNRAEIYWRLARNIYDRIESLPRAERPPKPERIRQYEKMIQLTDKCIELDPNDGNCWLWKGIGLGRRGTTKGILNSLADIDELEKYWKKAEELKPTYRAEDGSANALGDIYNALGQFYRVVPDWWIIKVLFGTRGDISKSVEYQRKAVALESERIEYNKELGVSLICYGQKKKDPKAIEEGKKYLKKVLELPVHKPSDRVDKKHSKILLENPDLACTYSRDAQQVVSKEEFEKTQKK